MWDPDTVFSLSDAFLCRDPPLSGMGAGEVTAFVGSLDQLADKTVLNDHTSLVALWT